MKKIDLGQTLGLLANVGVIIGIAFLALEMRQNSELLRAEIHQSRTDRFASDRNAMADSEFLLPAIAKMEAAGGFPDPESLKVLDDVEKTRVRSMMQAAYADYDNQYYQYRLGFLDDNFYQSRVVRSIRNLGPLWIEFGIVDGGTPEFRAEVQRVLAQE